MALSTVSSLHESFTSGVPLLTEEAAAPEGIKDKSSSPSVPLGDADKPTLPAISEGGEHAEDSQMTPPKVEEPTAQPGGDAGGAQEGAAGKSEEPPASEGAKAEDERGDDGEESGTDDDAILEVHS